MAISAKNIIKTLQSFVKNPESFFPFFFFDLLSFCCGSIKLLSKTSRHYTIQIAMEKAPKFLIRNKKINRDYETLDRIEAGISLLGHEVKTLKAGLGSINDSFVSIKDGEANLVGAHIPAYQPKNTPSSYDPNRKRKLLLNKKEIKELENEVRQKTLTLVPLSMYNKKSKIKVELAIVKGKKKFDKRLSIKKRDIERDIGRRLKN